MIKQSLSIIKISSEISMNIQCRRQIVDWFELCSLVHGLRSTTNKKKRQNDRKKKKMDAIAIRPILNRKPCIIFSKEQVRGVFKPAYQIISYLCNKPEYYCPQSPCRLDACARWFFMQYPATFVSGSLSISLIRRSRSFVPSPSVSI